MLNTAESAIIFRPPTLTPDFFQPYDQNEYLVPHLKDPIHIFLEPEAYLRCVMLAQSTPILPHTKASY